MFLIVFQRERERETDMDLHLKNTQNDGICVEEQEYYLQ